MTIKSTRTPTRLRLAVAATIPALVLASCGGASDNVVALGEDLVVDGEFIADADLYEAAAEEGELTIYSAYLESTEIAIAEQFTEDTGIDVGVVRLPGSQLLERTLSEAGSGMLPADVINQSDWEIVSYMHDEGVVEAYKVPDNIWEKIPAEWKQEDGIWYDINPVFLSPSYNTELVSEEEAPKSWEDLLDPKWRGKIAMPYAGVGGTGWSLALFQRQVLDENYWEDLSAQEPAILQSTANIVDELTRGEYPIAIVGASPVAEAAEDGAPVQPVYPDEGLPSVAYTLTKVADSPSPNAGAVYMNWRTSARGQNVMIDLSLSHGVHDDVNNPDLTAPDGSVPTLADLWLADKTDWVELRDEYIAEWNSVYNYSAE